MFNNRRCKWDRDIINVCPLCRQVGETEEYLLVECEGVKKECDIILKYMEERGGDTEWSEKTKIKRIHMISGWGEYIEVKDVKILEIMGLILYKWNKEWMKYRKVNWWNRVSKISM